MSLESPQSESAEAVERRLVAARAKAAQFLKTETVIEGDARRVLEIAVETKL